MKGITMNEPHKGEKFTIPEHIVRIAPKMHMTLAGQIRLLAFTKEVIEEIYQEHMLFQELFDACILETQTQGRYPQWKMMYELLRSHNFDNKTPSTDYKGVKATQHAIAGSPAGTPTLKHL